jgi:hypothetical protein
MRTITRSQAIAALRRQLLKLVDERESLCQVAARRGIFCTGLGRWSTEDLARRVPERFARGPEPTRAEVERLANRWLLESQDVRSGRLPCDAECGSRSPLCAGWDEFYESELSFFHRELCGEEVRVVPDDLLDPAPHPLDDGPR